MTDSIEKMFFHLSPAFCYKIIDVSFKSVYIFQDSTFYQTLIHNFWDTPGVSAYLSISFKLIKLPKIGRHEHLSQTCFAHIYFRLSTIL